MDNSQKNEDILIGIDYGDANIGLAFGRDGFTQPLSIISAKNIESAVSEIARAAVQNKVTKFVIGIPVNEKGKETGNAPKIRRFAKMLKIRTKRPVEFVDEFKTTIDSIASAIEMGVPQKKRGSIDHISAALILRKYYEERDSDA